MPIIVAPARKKAPTRRLTNATEHAIANAAMAWSLGNDGSCEGDKSRRVS